MYLSESAAGKRRGAGGADQYLRRGQAWTGTAFGADSHWEETCGMAGELCHVLGNFRVGSVWSEINATRYVCRFGGSEEYMVGF